MAEDDAPEKDGRWRKGRKAPNKKALLPSWKAGAPARENTSASLRASGGAKHGMNGGEGGSQLYYSIY